MKKILIALLCFLILLFVLLPFIDGYFFRKVYLQQIGWYQQQLADTSENRQQLKVESYHLGWFTSTAHLTLSRTPFSSPSSSEMPRIQFHIYSVIHHGPLLLSPRIKLAYAFIESRIEAPQLFQTFMPGKNAKNFMQIETFVSLNGDNWLNHYSIPALTIGTLQWEGMSGMMNIEMKNGLANQIESNMLLGKLNVASMSPIIPAIHLESISGKGRASQSSPNNWSVESSINWPGMTANWQDGRIFSLQNATISARSGIYQQLYYYDLALSIANMALPAPSPVSTLSSTHLTLAIENISLGEETKLAIERGEAQAFVKIFSPNTTLKTAFQTESNLGNASVNLIAGFLTLPATEKEISKNLTLTLTARIAQTLLNPLLKPTLVTQLLQQGIMVEDKSDYIISYTRKGEQNTLNGKVLSDDQLMQLIHATGQNTAPPATPTTVKPGQNQQGQVALPASSSHCYWMHSQAGKNTWELTPIKNKGDCFLLDSCSGGLGQSGGGCYKWAASPDAEQEPWR